MFPRRYIFGVVLLGGMTGLAAWAQAPKAATNPPAKSASGPASDVELVERLLAARREYQVSLEQLRVHYRSVGDNEKEHWAYEELLNYHRHARQPYVLELDVPPPTLQPIYNIPEANKLFQEAVAIKDKGRPGSANDPNDNYRWAELRFQQLLTSYPQSSKIDEAAFQLGEIYESKYYKQYRRAALYYERCFQWNPKTNLDARLRAARLYDKTLMEHGRAVAIYNEVLSHETDPKRQKEAQGRLTGLRSGK